MISPQHKLARAYGMWLEPDPIATPATTEGHAETPPRKGPGRPRKSPDTPRVEAAPARDSTPE